MPDTKRMALVVAGLIVALSAGLFVARWLGRNDGSAADSMTTAPAPSPTHESTPKPLGPKAQVRRAYLRYWRIYIEALKTLRANELDEVFTGRALQVVRHDMRERREKGIYVRRRVEHDMGIKIIDAVTAVVDDRYLNRAADIDPQTGEVIKRFAVERIHDVFTMRKVEGKWKVSAIARHSIKKPRR